MDQIVKFLTISTLGLIVLTSLGIILDLPNLIVITTVIWIALLDLEITIIFRELLELELNRRLSREERERIERSLKQLIMFLLISMLALAVFTGAFSSAYHHVLEAVNATILSIRES